MLVDYSSNVDTNLPLRTWFDCKQDSSQSTYKNVFISYKQNVMVSNDGWQLQWKASYRN